jgi:hypothetical protein
MLVWMLACALFCGSGTAVWRPNNSAARSNAPGMPKDPIDDLLRQARANTNSSSGDAAGAADRNLGLITLYANGFVIGNGEFRDIKEAKNKTTLEQLKRGEVPDELEEICRKEWGTNADQVSVNLVDKSQETFTPPKPKFGQCQKPRWMLQFECTVAFALI